MPLARSKRLRPVVLIAAALISAGCGSGHRASPAARSGTTARHNARSASRPSFQALAVPAHVAPHSVRIPILTYHRVHRYATELKKSQPDLTVEPEAFSAQMAALKRAGYETITQRQL